MPNIQLETLGGNKEQITVAFYYDVPANKQLSGAVDSTREPARGAQSALDQAGRDGLKAGSVFEFIYTFRPSPGMTGVQIRAAIVADRAAVAADAASEYESRYRFVGANYNGTVWG